MWKTLRWGVLGVSNFAMRKTIPASKGCQHAVVAAIASRNLERSKQAAAEHGIEKAYGSYEELLADPTIDVIYNPLPNHLHVEWSVRAAEAGKHVLCEKPVALSVEDLRRLVAARDRNGVVVSEAFMIRYHPQWLRVVELVRGGSIGDLRALSIAFSYFNRKPENVRNNPGYGGGGLWDIGCYAVHASRWLFGSEPVGVQGVIERDPEFGVDRLASAILQFPTGQAVFVCSTQMVPYQRLQAFGTKGRVELDIPFNAVPGVGMRVATDDGSDVQGSGIRVESVAACDQYTLEFDRFSIGAQSGGEGVYPLEDSIGNVATLQAIFRSAETGMRVVPGG